MIVYFKIKMKKNLVKLSLMLIVAFCPLFFVSCEKNKPSQSIIEMAIGEYELVDVHWEGLPLDLAYIIHSGFISGYQNRYGDNLKPPTNVYHRMTA